MPVEYILPTVKIPKVVTPETLSCWDVKFVAEVIPNVEIPETFNWVTDAIPPITFVDTPAIVA